MYQTAFDVPLAITSALAARANRHLRMLAILGHRRPVAVTGSQVDGRAFPTGEDKTCRNWTSSTQGAAMVGHLDRKGLRDDAASKSWNASHLSRGPDGGCSQNDLRSTGGNGLLYCFAAQ
jgi:hypothetical protein